MNPLALRARSYRSFDEVDLDLPQGCVAVIGENGAGKSSLINLIDIALFGAESRSLADALSDDGATEMELELTFEHAGEVYRVRRGYSARGRGKTLVDFEKLTMEDRLGPARDTGFSPLTCESTRETDALIEKTIGLSRATFRASAFLSQGDGAAFTDAKPADRKTILAEVLGLDVWGRLGDLAKADRRGAEAELQRLAGETDQTRTLVASKEDVARDRGSAAADEAETKIQLATVEAELVDLEARYRVAHDQAAQRQALAVQVKAAKAELERLVAEDARATDAVEMVRLAEQELASLPVLAETGPLVERERQLVAAISEHERARLAHAAAQKDALTASEKKMALIQRHGELKVNAAEIYDAVAALERSTHARCDRCKQILEGDSRQIAVKSMTSEAEALHAEADALLAEADAIVLPEIPAAPEGDPPTGELAEVRSQLETIQRQLQQRVRLEERVTQQQPLIVNRPAPEKIREAHASVTETEQALDEIEPVDLAAIQRQGEAARARASSLRDLHTTRVAVVARLDERLAQIAKAEQRLAEIGERETALHAEVSLCQTLERAYGRDGIPALVIENAAVPYIEAEAARILAALGGTTAACTVELRTQAALKSGDGLRDTLDVIIVGDNGERAYETFSGGERTRINLALRIALARLLAHRRGAESRLLAIDEPEFLDEAGTVALVDVLRGLQDDFDRVYLISHVPSLRDSFDDVIAVSKKDGRSRIEGQWAGIAADITDAAHV